MLESVIGPIVGGFIAGIIGYLSSKVMWDRQVKKHEELEEKNKKNILKGFLFELHELERKIDVLMSGYDLRNTTGNVIDAIILSNPSLNLSKSRSLYTNNGAFFIFNKEIFNLNNELFESLLNFYHPFLDAEESYKTYMQIPNDDSTKKLQTQIEFFNSINEACDNINEVIEKFECFLGSEETS